MGAGLVLLRSLVGGICLQGFKPSGQRLRVMNPEPETLNPKPVQPVT